MPTAMKPSTRRCPKSARRRWRIIWYSAGLPANRFTPVGYGSTQPVAGNDTDEGKAQNRRIDFVVK